MAVCSRQLRIQLLKSFKGNEILPQTQGGIDSLLMHIKRGGGGREVSNTVELEKHFANVTEPDLQTSSTDAKASPASSDLSDRATQLMENIEGQASQVEIMDDGHVHDHAARRLSAHAENGGMARLDKEKYRVVDFGDSLVVPPQSDERLVVWIRGQRVSQRRLNHEAFLDSRLDQMSAFIQRLGLGKQVKFRLSPAAIELVTTSADEGMLAVPARYLRHKVEDWLRRVRSSIEATARSKVGACTTFVHTLPSRLLAKLTNAVSTRVLRPVGLRLRGNKFPSPAVSATTAGCLDRSGGTTSVSSIDKDLGCSVEDNLALCSADPRKEAVEAAVEAEEVALRRELYEFVLVQQRDSTDGATTSMKLFKDVPCHLLALFLPNHRLELASSELFFLFSILFAGSVMPVYRSLTLAVSSPWVAEATLTALGVSLTYVVYSSFSNKRAFVRLRMSDILNAHLAASGARECTVMLRSLAKETANNEVLLSYYALLLLQQEREEQQKQQKFASLEGGPMPPPTTLSRSMDQYWGVVHSQSSTYEGDEEKKEGTDFDTVAETATTHTADTSVHRITEKELFTDETVFDCGAVGVRGTDVAVMDQAMRRWLVDVAFPERPHCEALRKREVVTSFTLKRLEALGLAERETPPPQHVGQQCAQQVDAGQQQLKTRFALKPLFEAGKWGELAEQLSAPLRAESDASHDWDSGLVSNASDDSQKHRSTGLRAVPWQRIRDR